MRFAIALSLCARVGVCAGLLAFVDVAMGALSSTQRLFEVDDLFELEGMGHQFGGPYAFSADGKRLAMTRVRAKKGLVNHKWEYLAENAGGDVWVQLDPQEPPENITHGADDGSGWWAPQWSPDGQKLALLSTRGGNVRAWVWDSKSRQLECLSARGVDLVRVGTKPYLWVDSTHLLYPALPNGEQPVGMKIELQTPEIATREWPKVMKGKEPTASVLQSGVAVDSSQQPQADLLLFDVNSGAERVIAKGATRNPQLSPSGEVVAFFRPIGRYRPSVEQNLWTSETGTVELARLDGTPLQMSGEASQDALWSSMRWSPRGDELAFFGYAAGRDQPPRLYRVDTLRRTVAAQTLKGLNVSPIAREPAQLEWTHDGDLIIFAARQGNGAAIPASPEVRRDWWLLKRSGSLQSLTAPIKHPPHELWPDERRRTYVGAADGELWRIDPRSGAIDNLTRKFAPRINAVAWPSAGSGSTDQYFPPATTHSKIIVSVQNAARVDYYRMDLQSGVLDALKKPAPDAELVAYEPRAAIAIFDSSSRDGLQVWRSDTSGAGFDVLVQANTFLRGIAAGQFKQIKYESSSGEPLKGWLLLPAAYEQGKSYPLLVWVYAGSMQGDRPPTSQGTLNSNSSLNMQIPAAHGYAVLFPSMPLKPKGEVDDPMLRLPEGVLPAVDQAIATGIVDSQRLYLMGQSFGGFSTYGLVVQTQRFNAAVALAGLSNFISLYGQFDARQRYTAYPHEPMFIATLMEAGQGRMGNPPWKDLGRYLRNSPIFHVDRVETPLMIIQGDMDYVAIQQGEEFFTALYRQGKRAEFVRYWGEGHVLESPANIRDMWQRIFAWFEQFPTRNSSEAAVRKTLSFQ